MAAAPLPVLLKSCFSLRPGLGLGVQFWVVCNNNEICKIAFPPMVPCTFSICRRLAHGTPKPSCNTSSAGSLFPGCGGSKKQQRDFVHKRFRPRGVAKREIGTPMLRRGAFRIVLPVQRGDAIFAIGDTSAVRMPQKPFLTTPLLPKCDVGALQRVLFLRRAGGACFGFVVRRWGRLGQHVFADAARNWAPNCVRIILGQSSRNFGEGGVLVRAAPC